MESKKEINSNGFDYVDLCLPSGTLWATYNVGASRPSDYGLYFQWGDIKGYTKEQIGIEKDQKVFSWIDYKHSIIDARDQIGIEKKQNAFSWTDFKYSIDNCDSSFSKYNKEGETLDLEDDSVHVNMGGNWHMPTPEQIQELIDNTTSEWMENDGVKGRLFISKKNASNSIFIPASGLAADGYVYSDKNAGCIWSSTLNNNITSGKCSGKTLYFRRTEPLQDKCFRYYGLPVRGVIG